MDDVDLVIVAALDGVGLAYLGEDRASVHLEQGSLARVIEPRSIPRALSVLAESSAATRGTLALIEALRL